MLFEPALPFCGSLINELILWHSFILYLHKNQVFNVFWNYTLTISTSKEMCIPSPSPQRIIPIGHLTALEYSTTNHKNTHFMNDMNCVFVARNLYKFNLTNIYYLII